MRRKRLIILFVRGQTPADAEFNYLDHAKRLDMYGVDLHRARVSSFIPLQ
jgi:tyrosine-protein phosphatase non-receptor type 4